MYQALLFTAPNKFNLLTSYALGVSLPRWNDRSSVTWKASFIASRVAKRNYKDPKFQEKSVVQESGSRDLNISEYEHSWRTAFAQLRIAFSFTFSPLRFRSRSHVAFRCSSRFIATFGPFLRNKYVSLGKQEAISAGLADQVIPAIPCDSSRWLPRASARGANRSHGIHFKIWPDWNYPTLPRLIQVG